MWKLSRCESSLSVVELVNGKLANFKESKEKEEEEKNNVNLFSVLENEETKTFMILFEIRIDFSSF